MEPYQHPLTDNALQELEFIPVKRMSYPVYIYKHEESFTNLKLTYQDGEYIFLDGNPLVGDREYFRGSIVSIDELKDIVKKLAGNGRAKTELGREVQDANYISTPSEELSDGILLAGGSMRWFKLSKDSLGYTVDYDQNRSGFDQATHSIGTFDSLHEAVTAVYRFK